MRFGTRTLGPSLSLVVLAWTLGLGGAVVAQTAKPQPAAQATATPQAAPGRQEALAVARRIMEAVRYCAVITVDASGRPQAREVDAFPPDEQLVVWFATVPKSRKIAEIKKDPRVTLYYADVKDIGQGYVTVLGHARIVTDPAEKAKHWKTSFEAFWPDRNETYVLVEVVPDRVEVLSPMNNIMNDPVTWTPTIIDMKR